MDGLNVKVDKWDPVFVSRVIGVDMVPFWINPLDKRLLIHKPAITQEQIDSFSPRTRATCLASSVVLMSDMPDTAGNIIISTSAASEEKNRPDVGLVIEGVNKGKLVLVPEGHGVETTHVRKGVRSRVRVVGIGMLTEILAAQSAQPIKDIPADHAMPAIIEFDGDKVNVLPTGRNIHAKRLRPETSAGGIVLADNSKFGYSVAIAVGPDVADVEVGDVFLSIPYCNRALEGIGVNVEKDSYLLPEYAVIMVIGNLPNERRN